jgi:hypothetical protein
MSSPMMTTMLGFGCCAVAGAAATNMATDEANRPSPIVLLKFMLWFLVLPETGRQPVPCRNHAARSSRRVEADASEWRTLAAH